MRLIDADLAKVMLMYRARLVHYGFEDRLCVPYDTVDEVPTVGDAVPVVHGWCEKVESSYYRWTPSGGTSIDCTTYRCGRCGRGTAVKSNYCPNCGAKMDADTQEREETK